MRGANSALFPQHANEKQLGGIFCDYWERGAIFLQGLL